MTSLPFFFFHYVQLVCTVLLNTANLTLDFSKPVQFLLNVLFCYMHKYQEMCFLIPMKMSDFWLPFYYCDKFVQSFSKDFKCLLFVPHQFFINFSEMYWLFFIRFLDNLSFFVCEHFWIDNSWIHFSDWVTAESWAIFCSFKNYMCKCSCTTSDKLWILNI